MKTDNFIKKCLEVLRMKDGGLYSDGGYLTDPLRRDFVSALSLLVSTTGPLAMDGELFHIFNEIGGFSITDFKNAEDVDVPEEIWVRLRVIYPLVFRSFKRSNNEG